MTNGLELYTVYQQHTSMTMVMVMKRLELHCSSAPTTDYNENAIEDAINSMHLAGLLPNITLIMTCLEDEMSPMPLPCVMSCLW